jgi:hypothetical protein
VLPGEPFVLSAVLDPNVTPPVRFDLSNGSNRLPPESVRWHIDPAQTVFVVVPGSTTMTFPATYRIVASNPVRPDGVASVAAEIRLRPDDDRDGLADAWENEFFGATGTDPEADADFDGSNHRAEFVAGTDPTRPTDALAVSVRALPSRVELQFEAVASRTYTVQVSDRIVPALWRAWKHVPAAATNRIVDLADPDRGATRAYRLVTPFQP